MSYDKYRFGRPTADVTVYASGAEAPHLEVPVLRMLPDETWEVIGYVELHTHPVNRDTADADDVSFGVTVRHNPKRPPKIGMLA